VTEPAAYLTPREVQTLLNVSLSAVYRLAKDDPTVPVLRLGGTGRPDRLGREGRVTLRFPRERLLAWLRSREQGVPRASKLLLSEVGR
jgi:predicted DNA-binding transcriptional regulator AlpA